jgi:RimJ/RimL family protein N-acetyltransferase
MIPVIRQIPKEAWAVVSEDAHLIAFGEHKPAFFDRIDFALLAVTEQEEMMGYITCREFDHETLYWQFGGAFPGTKETVKSWAAYKAFGAWCSDKYKRVATLIENDNTAMMKMAMKLGFRVIGVRNFKGSILLEHVLEF